MFELVPFSTCSHSGVNTRRQIHLSWKLRRAALLVAAANFPHLPVVPLTTPPTLPASKAAPWRRQESRGSRRRCALSPRGGGELPAFFKKLKMRTPGFWRARRLFVRRCFKAAVVVFLCQESRPGVVRSDASKREQVDI